MRVLGITGGIATGKSTVTQMLADLGAPTISADAVAREVLAPGTAATASVLAAFPGCTEVNDAGVIDRRALGRIIFADPAARARLEALTHPAIRAVMRSQIDAWHAAGEGTAAAEIPLLFESKLEWLVDKIVVVACAETTQIERLRARLGIGEAEARRQITAQWPLADKVARADFVIITDGYLEDTRRQVQAFWGSL